jgi:hypothetical protein
MAESIGCDIIKLAGYIKNYLTKQICMKNLCYFLRQNIVHKPSMASIKEGNTSIPPTYSKQQNCSCR